MPESEFLFRCYSDPISPTHPEFSEAIKRGKLEADANVADRLYQRAMGYAHAETHVSNYRGAITLTLWVKHYPDGETQNVDTNAAIISENTVTLSQLPPSLPCRFSCFLFIS